MARISQGPAIAVAAIVLTTSAFTAPAAVRDGVTRVFDGERVTIWDVTWSGARPETAVSSQDAVRILLDPGAEYLPTRSIGDVSWHAKGSPAPPAGGSGTQREIVVGLKEAKVAPFVNTSGQPNAFPRPGIRGVIENARVAVWDYTWIPNKATPVHFHDKDVVVVYLADGVIASTTPDGKVANNPHSFGFAKFNPGNRVHFESLASGSARAIIVELK